MTHTKDYFTAVIVVISLRKIRNNSENGKKKFRIFINIKSDFRVQWDQNIWENHTETAEFFSIL